MQGTANDVAMLADGHFVIIWTSLSGDLRAKEFNADGTAYADGITFNYIVVDPGPVQPNARVAISAVGEYSVVVSHGPIGRCRLS